MKNIKTFDEYVLAEANNVEIFNKQKNKFIASNLDYNNDAFDKSDKMKDPNYKYTNSSEIPIGCKNPVAKFKSLTSRYWRKKKDLKKKYEPQAKQ